MGLKILLSGASGAIGQTIVSLIANGEQVEVVGRADRAEFFEPDTQADAIIDFSHPELLERVVPYARDRRLPLITGTTAVSAAVQSELEAAATVIPICQAANFSLGVNLLRELAVRSAEALNADFEIEILETHHRRKLDAPSGTALWLGEAIAQARGGELDDSVVHDRSRLRQARRTGEIGIQALRGGDVAGEHTVYFLADGERLELAHRATDRRIFARGALLAAKRLVGREPGMIEFAGLVLSGDRITRKSV